MKSKRNQQTLHESIYTASRLTGIKYQITNCIDTALNYRPYKEHHNTDTYNARRMKEKGLSTEDIMEITGLTLEEVHQL